MVAFGLRLHQPYNKADEGWWRRKPKASIFFFVFSEQYLQELWE